MTQDGARAWLPKNAFSRDAVSACLAGPVMDWSQRWLVRGNAAVAAVRCEDASVSAQAPSSLYIRCATATLEIPGRGRRRLLEAVLDVDLSVEPLTESDRRLLDVLARQILEDLAVGLEKVLDAAADSTSRAHLAVQIAIGEHEFLTLCMPDCALVPLLRRHAGGPRPASRPVMRRSDALRRTKVDLFGFLGRADIAIHELKDLSIGDVLVLDHALAEPVELRVSESDSVLTCGRLCQNANQFSIQL